MKTPSLPSAFSSLELFHGGGPASPLICRGNQWTGFYMTGTSIIKELIKVDIFFKSTVISLTPVFFVRPFLTIITTYDICCHCFFFFFESSHHYWTLTQSEAYSGPCQTSEMKRFAKKDNGWKPLTFFAKCSILDCRF